ncbi:MULTISPECIES: glycoside hydrolase family 2 TIM barrel-domain containing protein [Flavobacteriaceae]|uniref:glycoside hydrolase family 2 TIM barrel-domain containing protein n=1 Tax=Flavobacteriaceae TaxID=49546 RepID=UPI001491F8B9|nr:MULTISPECIES: glycoside hydrolase family 2 TIM barrel-domain containing protein [Allomuricauda]MDC6367636.1 glycoside hydrolase family 2 TIM barrel-domain containing protein [Muricauda sp. AC10]
MIKKKGTTLFYVLLCLCLAGMAQQTEKIYLSGTDFEHPKRWEFKCTNGQNCEQWSNIDVPSNWELQGFGEYTYGRWYKELNLKEPSKEQGLYKYHFNIPAEYQKKHINIVFEGVMTDTEVFINGKKAGPTHQGGFYRFKYDITKLINFDSQNLLEVNVSKHSANHSVNRAERYADWWLFGGIYRPVWLEILPKDHMVSLRVDAKHDGKLTLATEINHTIKSPSLSIALKKLGDKTYGPEKSFPLSKNQKKDTISTSWENIIPWTPESPNLYELKVELKSNNAILHQKVERIGFRTLEFLSKDGIYVNGTKIIMKGVDRHSIWPESGRSLSKRISIMDVELIKGMNMNAVRTHYPPATHFLKVCDSLGLFVLDELAGWQNPYDDALGAKLAKSMLDRDANHPSIIIWDNGNEGGWGPGADRVFKTEDLQKRIVIHPWSDFEGWDTHHYPTYQTGVHRFNNGENVFFPTEFMHSTYDNGGGAGLEDFWNKYIQSPLFTGGFIWAFVDEAVLRTDWKGERKYDSAGSLAPDGIVGPHREKEGSYFSIKDIFSPVQFKPTRISKNFNGALTVGNTSLYTNLNTYTYIYKIFKLDENVLYNHAQPMEIHSETKHFPDVMPEEFRRIQLKLPTTFFEGDWVQLEAFDQTGKSINTFTWPIHHNNYFSSKLQAKQSVEQKAYFKDMDNQIYLSANGMTIKLDKSTGFLTQITNGKATIPLTNGPKPVGMEAKVDSVKSYIQGKDAIADVFYSGALDKITWTLTADGRLNLNMTALQKAKTINGFDGPIFDDKINAFGITFDFPEDVVKGFTWFGKGPYRVWKNRQRGTQFGLWQKDYNNTITGESFDNLIYPEFKGYHANFYAGTLDAGDGSFKFFSENDNTFLRLFTPDEPEYAIKGRSHPQPEFPEGDFSFLYEIPAMRSFKPIPHHGPNSQPSSIRIKKGDEGIHMSIWFDFRTINQ